MGNVQLWAGGHCSSSVDNIKRWCEGKDCANERGGDLRHGDKQQPPVDVRVDVPVVKYERVEGVFFVGMLP